MSQANRAYRQWLATRPPKVRETLTRWPVDSVVTDGMQRFFVLGASESGNLLITPVDPNQDYDGAVAMRRVCCAGCLKDGRLHFVEQPHADH